MAKARKYLDPNINLLEGLEPLSLYENPRAVLYKTVDTFSGIIQRKLWLTHDSKGSARTDGHSITVDLDDDDVYRKVEHELSHILFKSDSTAKVLFVETYSAHVVAFAAAHGQVLDVPMVRDLVDFTLNLIEDHRVDSLWGLLYPGSAALQKELHRAATQTYVKHCHGSYLLYFACVEGGVEIPSGPLDAYRSLFETALRKVEHKGFLAALLLSRWLVTQLLAEIVRQTLIPPPNHTPVGRVSQDAAGPSSSPQATPEEQVAAIVEVLKACKVPNELREEKADVRSNAYKERGAAVLAKQMTTTVMKTDVMNVLQIDEALIATQQEMEGILDKARQAIRPTVNTDDWIRKDSMAKVVFHDMRQGVANSKPPPLTLSDQEAVRRLRAVFLKVMGRRRACLDDCGLEIDVQAFIERQISRTPVPCFRQEERGRGFKTVILLDRSSSMAGERTQQAERACRIIGQALKFPFVQTNVWGFQSLEHGQVDVVRFDPLTEIYTSSDSKVEGNTPLHTAIRLAVRYLERGSEAKQLIVLTDGEPCFSRKGGERVPTSTLQFWVRDEVHYARRHGINVTCLMIGTFVPPDKLRRMFGSQANWKTINEHRLGSDLVNVVTSSFVKYLKSR